MGENSLDIGLSLDEGLRGRQWTGRQQGCLAARLGSSWVLWSLGMRDSPGCTPQARWEAAKMIQGSFYSGIMSKYIEQMGLRDSPHSNHFSGLHGNPQLQRSRMYLIPVSVGRNNAPIYAGTELSLWETGPNAFTQVTTLVTCPCTSLEWAKESGAWMQIMRGSGIWEGGQETAPSLTLDRTGRITPSLHPSHSTR